MKHSKWNFKNLVYEIRKGSLIPMKKPCDRFRFRQQSVQTNLVATAKAMKPCASKGIMIRTPPTPTGGRQLDWFYTLDIFQVTILVCLCIRQWDGRYSCCFVLILNIKISFFLNIFSIGIDPLKKASCQVFIVLGFSCLNLKLCIQ